MCRAAAQKERVSHLSPPGSSHCHAHLSPRHSVAGREADSVGLYRAAMAGDLVAMAAVLARGAEVNGSISEEAGRTALIGAAIGVKYEDA